jgi:hypothetical protein
MMLKAEMAAMAEPVETVEYQLAETEVMAGTAETPH